MNLLKFFALTILLYFKTSSISCYIYFNFQDPYDDFWSMELADGIGLFYDDLSLDSSEENFQNSLGQNRDGQGQQNYNGQGQQNRSGQVQQNRSGQGQQRANQRSSNRFGNSQWQRDDSQNNGQSRGTNAIDQSNNGKSDVSSQWSTENDFSNEFGGYGQRSYGINNNGAAGQGQKNGQNGAKRQKRHSHGCNCDHEKSSTNGDGIQSDLDQRQQSSKSIGSVRSAGLENAIDSDVKRSQQNSNNQIGQDFQSSSSRQSNGRSQRLQYDQRAYGQGNQRLGNNKDQSDQQDQYGDQGGFVNARRNNKQIRQFRGGSESNFNGESNGRNQRTQQDQRTYDRIDLDQNDGNQRQQSRGLGTVKKIDLEEMDGFENGRFNGRSRQIQSNSNGQFNGKTQHDQRQNYRYSEHNGIQNEVNINEEDQRGLSRNGQGTVRQVDLKEIGGLGNVQSNRGNQQSRSDQRHGNVQEERSQWSNRRNNNEGSNNGLSQNSFGQQQFRTWSASGQNNGQNQRRGSWSAEGFRFDRPFQNGRGAGRQQHRFSGNRIGNGVQQGLSGNRQDLSQLQNLTTSTEKAFMELINMLNETQKVELGRLMVEFSSDSKAEFDQAIEGWIRGQGENVQTAYNLFRESRTKLTQAVESFHTKVSANLSSEAQVVDKQLLLIINNGTMDGEEQCEEVRALLGQVPHSVLCELRRAFGPLPCGDKFFSRRSRNRREILKNNRINGWGNRGDNRNGSRFNNYGSRNETNGNDRSENRNGRGENRNNGRNGNRGDNRNDSRHNNRESRNETSSEGRNDDRNGRGENRNNDRNVNSGNNQRSRNRREIRNINNRINGWGNRGENRNDSRYNNSKSRNETGGEDRSDDRNGRGENRNNGRNGNRGDNRNDSRHNNRESRNETSSEDRSDDRNGRGENRNNGRNVNSGNNHRVNHGRNNGRSQNGQGNGESLFGTRGQNGNGQGHGIDLLGERNNANFGTENGRNGNAKLTKSQF